MPLPLYRAGASGFRFTPEYIPAPNPSLLQRIGYGLDTPGRWVREFLTGRSGATGRDVLQSFGVRNPGFWGGLGTEVLLDPLNLLAGVGGMTKAGKLAKALEATTKQTRALQLLRKTTANQDVARELGEQLVGVMARRREALQGLRALGAPTRLAPTLGARARAGQNALVHVGLPFGPSAPLIRGAPVLGALGAAGGALRGTPVISGLERLVRSPGRRLEAIRDIAQPAQQAKLLSEGSAVERGRRYGLKLEELVQEAGLPRKEYLEKFSDLRESLDIPERLEAFRRESIGRAAQRSEDYYTKVADKRLAQAQKRLEAAERTYNLRKTFGVRLAGSEQELQRARELYRRERQANRAGRKIVGETEASVQREIGQPELLRPYKLPQQTFPEKEGLSRRLREGLLARGRKGQAVGRGMSPAEILETAQRERGRRLRFLDITKGRLGRAGEALDRPLSETIPATSTRYLDAPRAARFVEAAEQSRVRAYDEVRKFLERGPSKSQLRRVKTIQEGLEKRLGRIAEEEKVVNKALQALPASSRAFAKELFDETERTFQAQAEAGARIGGEAAERLQSKTRQYAARVLTPEAQDYFARNPEEAEKFYSKVTGKIKTMEGSQIRRSLFREEFTTEANRWVRENAPDVDFDWFELDPSKAVPRDLLNKEISTINARLLESLADNFQGAFKAGDVPLEQYLAEVPLHSYKGLTIGARPEKIGRDLEFAGMGGRGLPQAVMEEAKPIIEKFSSPKELAPLLKAYDRYMSLMRFSLTSPFPAFHTRNATTNVVMNWLGGVSNPKWYVKALAEQKRLANKPEEAARLYGAVLKGTQAGDILRDFERSFRQGAKAGVMRRGVEKVGKISRAVENNARLAHYLAKKNAGLSHYEALRSVNKYLFDYSDLTSAEQTVGKRLAMFYQWSRNAIPRILAEYLENPRKMALLQRAITRPGDDRPLPPFLRKTLAIPAGGDSRNQKYILGLGLPLEELLKFDVYSETEPGGKSRALLRNLAGLSATPIKAGLERIADSSFFLDKPLLEADRAPAWMRHLPKGAQDVVGFKERRTSSGRPSYRADPLLLWLMQQTPISRASSTAGKLSDPRRGLMDKLVNILSGARTTNIDPRVMDIEAKKQSLEAALNQLVREGEAGRFRGFFATGEKAEKNPQVKLLLQHLRDVGRQRKELLKQNRY